MAKVIKHFEGFGTATPYTVPSGKIAQIQGMISLSGVSGTAFSSFSFSNTTVTTETPASLGLTFVMHSDSSWVIPSGPDNNTSSITKYRLNVQSSSGPHVNLRGGAYYISNFAVSGNGVTSPMLPGPRIYLSAGDSMSFSQHNNGFVGWNFVAIEEDA